MAKPQYRANFGPGNSVTLHDFVTGTPVPVKSVYPANRGPLMVKPRGDKPRSIYDLAYETRTGRAVPTGKRAVPTDYTADPNTAKLTLRTVEQIDKEYRERTGPGTKSKLDLLQVQGILSDHEKGVTVPTICALHKIGVSTFNHIRNGKVYWYAR